MRILLNGTTGLLGRNLLFEILKHNLSKPDDLEIIVLDKSKDGITLKQRIVSILLNDGFDYLDVKTKDRPRYLNFIMQKIILIEYDLTLPNLGISNEVIQKLQRYSIDCCFHIAALTNFIDTPGIVRQLEQINYYGTVKMLELVCQLKVKRFCYISTVYSAGSAVKEIFPDYINTTGIFRNPYEKSKLDAELFLIDFANRYNIDYRIYRVSIISGRLIEKQIGSVCKFDVFYQFASFILKYKYKILGSAHDLYTQDLNIDLQIELNPESTMNICPADYGAKLIFYSSIAESDYTSFHIVNDSEINIMEVIEQIMSALNITGYSIVNKIPIRQNPLEQLYYRSVGKIFTPYIIEPALIYNNDNLQKIKEDNALPCPQMDITNFQKLLDYAKKYYFGIKL